MKRLLIKLIRIYQKTLSPDEGWFSYRYPYGYCRFYPHCSEYAAQAIAKKNLFIAFYLIIKRLSKCHPWHEPQVDQVK